MKRNEYIPIGLVYVCMFIWGSCVYIYAQLHITPTSLCLCLSLCLSLSLYVSLSISLCLALCLSPYVPLYIYLCLFYLSFSPKMVKMCLFECAYNNAHS